MARIGRGWLLALLVGASGFFGIVSYQGHTVHTTPLALRIGDMNPPPPM